MRGTITASGLQPQSHRRQDCFAGPNSDSVWGDEGVGTMECSSSSPNARTQMGAANGSGLAAIFFSRKFVSADSPLNRHFVRSYGLLFLWSPLNSEAPPIKNQGPKQQRQPALQGCDLAKTRAHSGRAFESWQGAVRQRGAVLGSHRPVAVRGAVVNSVTFLEHACLWLFGPVAYSLFLAENLRILWGLNEIPYPPQENDLSKSSTHTRV